MPPRITPTKLLKRRPLKLRKPVAPPTIVFKDRTKYDRKRAPKPEAP